MVELVTIKKNQEYLRQRSKDVDLNDPQLQQNIEELKEYTMANRVYAMAAVQLGIPKRILFIKSLNPSGAESEEDERICMINPKVVAMKGRTEFWEACQSCLGYFGLVDRPYMLEVEYTDENGMTKFQKFEGFVSTVISHELDHFDGIFHMDRAKEIIAESCDNFEETKRKIRASGYKVLSQDCEFSYPEIRKRTW